MPSTRSASTTSKEKLTSASTDGVPEGSIQRTRSKQREETYDAKYAVDLATHTTHENIFLFVPNLIGYSRIILAALSLYYMKNHPKLCTVLYGISCLLDAFDGMAARALGQTSKFGAVLDMVTDRCTTSCLLCFLASAYPDYALLFQFLIALDFSSHYIHMYSSLVTGSSSHKTVTSEVSRILWYYYNDSRTLFLVCFGNELFFVTLYLNHFYTTPLFTSSSIASGNPIASALLSFVSNNTKSSTFLGRLLWHPKAGEYLYHWTNSTSTGITWPQILLILTGPVCLLKNVINVVQFWKASKILVGVDLAERAAARRLKSEKEAGQGKAS